MEAIIRILRAYGLSHEDRLNAIIVVSHDPSKTDEVLNLVEGVETGAGCSEALDVLASDY